MKITTEKTLSDFEFWAGAASNADKLTADELDSIESLLEEVFPSGIDETTLNDFFWHDFYTICEWLDLDEDEVLSRNIRE